ncbi:MAG: hypothetical protein ACRDCT_18945 [Shewanella sp.]
MKTITLIGLSLLLANMIFSHVHAEEKWTYEKAMESHKKNVGSSYIDHQARIDEWNSVNRIPILTENGGSAGKLTEVWSGKSTLVKNEWGEGAFLVQLADPYNTTDTVASLWLKVDGSKLQRSSAVSMYGYEKSWFVEYKSGMFYGVGIRESAPSIVSISKQEVVNKVYNDCTPGQTQGTQNTTCANPSVEKLCEAGYTQRSCATNGTWLPWETKAPLCVRRDRNCP